MKSARGYPGSASSRRATVPREAPGWSSLLGMGSVVALFVVGGLALGWLADRFLQTFPILALIGLALGIAGACRYTYVEFRRYLED